MIRYDIAISPDEETKILDYIRLPVCLFYM